MKQSDALQDLQLFGMTQELCDEIDDAFRLIKSQADEIESLKEDVRMYRRMAGLDPPSGTGRLPRERRLR